MLDYRNRNRERDRDYLEDRVYFLEAEVRSLRTIIDTLYSQQKGESNNPFSDWNRRVTFNPKSYIRISGSHNIEYWQM